MDIERTIEFILDNQAKTEVRLTSLTRAVQQGMKVLVKNNASIASLARAQKRTEAAMTELARAQRRTEVKMSEMAAAQKATQQSLKALINSLIRSPNGKHGR